MSLPFRILTKNFQKLNKNSMSEDQSSKMSEWIGIDLGTTKTVAAVYNRGGVEVLYVVESGGTLTDSCVYYDQGSDVMLVGKQAAQQKAKYPENTICDSKRIMCLAFSEDSIKEFQDKMKQFKIVNSGGYAAYEIRHCGRTIRQTPIDIAAKMLKKIRQTADEWANGVKKFDKAVITVPLKFGQEQLVGTIRAAKMAGFSEVHLVKEPNAAAYFYGFKHLRLDGFKMLVLDFGGGTLDVSILKVENGDFEVLATCGRKWLGGRDLDELVRKEIVKRIKAQFDFDCNKCSKGHNTEYKTDCEGCHRVKRNMQVLLDECERLKIDLSTQQKSSIDCYKIGIEGEVHLTRKEYEDLVEDQLNDVIETVIDTLGSAGLSPVQIQELQMTGGSSCTPILLDMLEEIGFTSDKIKRLEPMHAIARGAAIVGAQLDKQVKAQLPSMTLVEICPLSIGIKTFGGLFEPIIHIGTKIPCSNEKVLCTVKNDQQTVALDIYEGERKLALENNHLTDFTIYNLPKGAAGDVSIKVKLSINRDGILHAQANHKDNIAILNMNTNYKEKRIDSDKVDQMIHDAELHHLADSLEYKRIEKKAELITAIERAKYKCNDPSILAICTEFEKWVNLHPNADFQAFENRLVDFRSRLYLDEYDCYYY